MIIFLLLYCLSFHAVHVLIFLAAWFYYYILAMYTCLLENSEVKAHPLDVYITLVIILIYTYTHTEAA